MSERHQPSITDAVMAQLKQGKVTMRSRLYFTLLTMSAISATALLTLALAYLTSIVFFWLRIQNADTMAWGARANLAELIGSFPWWALVIAIGTLALTAWLIHHQGTMYRHKTSTIIAVIVGASFILGLVFTSFGIGNIHVKNQRPIDTQMQRGRGWQQHYR